MSVIPAAPLAPPRGVDLWLVPLQQSPARIAELIAGCSEAEHARAARMPVDARRREFLIARGVVRTILAAYMDIDALVLPLRTGAHGKPFIDASGAPAFSVSHSAGLVVVAVTASFAVGVDLERVDRRLDVEAVAARFLPDCESALLSALAPGARHAAFFRLWTRHEALLKARGCGFATGVGDAFAPIPSGAGAQAEGAHTLTELEVGPGYVGALAYHASPTTLDTPDRALVRL